MNEVVKLQVCPICHKSHHSAEYAPFCSKRCADVDLGRWFNGSYAVASEDLDDLEIQELDEALANAERNSE